MQLKDNSCVHDRVLPEQESRLALLPVVSLAWYLSRVLPETMNRDRLELWVIGAELIDGRDDGAWYNCLGALLDIPEIHYHLISPTLTSTRNNSVFGGTLETFLEQGNSVPDIAVIFQPGFEENASLLEAGLGVLLKAGTRVIASSYSEEEFERDRLMAQAFGFQVSESLDNPFSLDPSDTGLHWADRLWHFMPEVPDDQHAPDQALIDAVRCLSRMVAHSRLQGIWVQPAPPGSLFEIPDTEGGRREMIHIFDNYYLDRAARTLYGLDGGRLRSTEIRVSSEEVGAYPKNGIPVERALWAAGIKNRYLLAGK
jgi:hypothetical protein